MTDGIDTNTKGWAFGGWCGNSEEERRLLRRAFLLGFFCGALTVLSLLESCHVSLSMVTGDACRPWPAWVAGLTGGLPIAALAWMIVGAVRKARAGDELAQRIEMEAWTLAAWVTLATLGILGFVELVIDGFDVPLVVFILPLVFGYVVGLARAMGRYN